MHLLTRFLLRARKALLVAAAVLLWSGGFEEQLRCEEAAKHLADCCPTLTALHFNCDYNCDQFSFPLAEAECLLALDCDALRAGGYCQSTGQPAQECR